VYLQYDFPIDFSYFDPDLPQCLLILQVSLISTPK
jgi:hypothetical protein